MHRENIAVDERNRARTRNKTHLVRLPLPAFDQNHIALGFRIVLGKQSRRFHRQSNRRYPTAAGFENANRRFHRRARRNLHRRPQQNGIARRDRERVCVRRRRRANRNHPPRQTGQKRRRIKTRNVGRGKARRIINRLPRSAARRNRRRRENQPQSDIGIALHPAPTETAFFRIRQKRILREKIHQYLHAVVAGRRARPGQAFVVVVNLASRRREIGDIAGDKAVRVQTQPAEFRRQINPRAVRAGTQNNILAILDFQPTESFPKRFLSLAPIPTPQATPENRARRQHRRANRRQNRSPTTLESRPPQRHRRRFAPTPARSLADSKKPPRLQQRPTATTTRPSYSAR